MDGESCIRKAYDDILRGDFEGAIHWFELAIEADPGNSGYYHKCAVSCARSNKWHKAKHYADVASGLEPGNVEFVSHAQFVQARLLLEEANLLLASMPPRLPEAGEKLQQAIKLDPISFDCYYTLGMIRYSEGDLEAAHAYVREALLLDPQHAAAKRLFADVKRKLRKRNKNNHTHRDKR